MVADRLKAVLVDRNTRKHRSRQYKTVVVFSTMAVLGMALVIHPSPARADAIYPGIPTFGGGNENIGTTLGILDAAFPGVVYLGSYLGSSPGAVATPPGESISGTGANSTSGTITTTGGSPSYVIDFYDVKAGPNSVLIQVSSPASTVNWTTDWTPLLVGQGNVPSISHIDVFGILSSVSIPEPDSVSLLGLGVLGLGLLRLGFRRQ